MINYSFPLTTEDYVHRIGRTGRAGKTGEGDLEAGGMTRGRNGGMELFIFHCVTLTDCVALLRIKCVPPNDND